MFAAQFSGRQPATISLDVGISAIKIAIPFLFAIFAQELLVKEFEKRNYLQSLAYPHGRISFFLSRWCACLIAVLIFYFIASFTLLAVVGFVSAGYEQNTSVSLDGKYWVVIIAGLVDILAVSTFAALFAVVAKSPGFVLIGTLGVTVIARSYSYILQLLNADMLAVDNPESYQGGLSLVSFVIPDLGVLDFRQIALYSNWSFLPPGLLNVVLAPILFSIAVLCLAALLFKYRSAA